MDYYKIQITAIAVITILLINYFRNKKLPLMSTKIFSVFMIVSTVNLVFDIVTVYTINHMDSVSPVINRICHQVFIGSLDVMAYLLFLYVNNLAHKQKRLSLKQLILLSLPLIATMGIVIFAPLYYHIGENGNYSYGPMAYTVYVSVAAYLICVAVNLKRAKEAISKERKTLIGCGMLIWGMVAVIQFFIPTLLISSLANLLMILLVYLSFENPREYADAETGCLNRMAFHRMISEMFERRKSFYVVDYVIDNVDYIQDVFGYSSVRTILFSLNQKISSLTGAHVFHSRSHMLSVVTTSLSTVERLKKNMGQGLIDWHVDNGEAFAPTFHMDVIECPKYAKFADKLYEMIDYLNEDLRGRKGITEVTEEIVNEYQRFVTIQDLVEDAIHNDGLEVYYQPIFSNESKSFSSAEALVRLKNTKTLGFISPEVFIPIAERKGLIKELGNIVFDKVCQFMTENKIASLGVDYIEVNLSRVQEADTNLAHTLKEVMNRYEISPRNINLEVTETASVEISDIIINNMHQLRECGCHFSMDDFGTGYSNLAHVAKVKYELIKLDKSLVWPCFEEKGRDAHIILKNCVKMLLELGVKIVAEGVETKEQVDLLTDLGVTYLQGYYFSRPINGNSYLEFLRNNTAL